MNSSPSGAKQPNVNRVVLDASAILAVINREVGREKLPPDLLAKAVASTVNLAEVHAKLVTLGWPARDAWQDATSAISEAFVFDQEHARISGDLIPLTRPLGLSLGDRACLALGLALNTSVFTADRTWKKLKLDVPIHVIR